MTIKESIQEALKDFDIVSIKTDREGNNHGDDAHHIEVKFRDSTGQIWEGIWEFSKKAGFKAGDFGTIIKSYIKSELNYIEKTGGTK